MGIGEIFNLALVNPIFNILLVFLVVFGAWGLPGSLGWAIIAVTSVFRIVFNPMYKKQLEMAAQMEMMRPKLEKIQAKYKSDPKRVQQEQLKLYQEHGINPASGCLMGIAQIPLVIALYQVLLKVFEKDNLSHFGDLTAKLAYADFLKIKTLDPHFLGLNLGVTPSTFNENGIYYLLVPAVTAFLQYYQLTVSQPKKTQEDEDKNKLEKSGKNQPKKEESFQEVFQKQSKVMFPLMVGYFSYILPTGLALYWNVFSIFSILQARHRSQWKKK